MPSDVDNKPTDLPQVQTDLNKVASALFFNDAYGIPTDTFKKTDVNKDKPEKGPKTGDGPASGNVPATGEITATGDVPPPGDASVPGTTPAPGKPPTPGDAPGRKQASSADLQKQLDNAVLNTLALYATAALTFLSPGPKGDSTPSGPQGPVKPGGPAANRGITPPVGKPGGDDGPTTNMQGGDPMSPAPGDKPVGKAEKRSEPATKAGSDGKSLTTSTTVNGVGQVDFAATRGKDNRVDSLEMKIGADTHKLIKGADGNWKFQSASGQKTGDEKALKTLETLGIKPDGDGKFGGQLDVTSDGNLRYQNSDSPDKQVTYLGQNGTTARYDYGNYTRTITDKGGGQKSFDAWNGKEFVPVEGGIKTTTNQDGSVTSSVNLKGGANSKIERTTHPGNPTTGNGKRDELTVTKRTTDGTAGEASQFNWLEGTKTVGGKTKYLDGTTGNYRDGKKEGNKVTFTEADPASKATSVTRDSKAGTVTYKGDKGYEVTKNSNTDQVISSTTSGGKITLGYDASSGKGSGSVNKININGNGFTRVGPNRDGTSLEMAEGKRTLGDFNPKTSDLNTYRNDKTGETVRMSVAVGQDGTVKVAREGRRGDEKAATQEFRPQGERSFSNPKDLAKANAELRVTKDATGAPTEYTHANANLKLSKSDDGSWKAEALDGKKPFNKPTEFQKNVYTSNNLDASQKLRLVENSKKIDGMTNFSAEQKKEVYKQADRLLNGRQDSAIPANEKAALADQLLWHVTNPGRNDQGFNNTCNTTVLRSLALKDKPEVVAKLAADVANDGQFKTSAGMDIKVAGDSVRARPGSPESTFPPADGARSALGKLWDVSTINSVYQSESNGAHRYEEHTPKQRDDTGGRQIFTDKDGKEYVLYSRAKDGGGEKPNDNPGMSSTKIADAWKQLTGEPLTGKFLSHANRGMSHPDIVGGKFKSPDELHQHLVKNNREGGKPVVVQGNTGKLDQIARNLDQPTRGGEHVWVVSNYDANTKTATIQNSWGKTNDIKMSLNDLYTAMETKSHNPLSDRTQFLKPYNGSGSDRTRKLNG